MATFRVMVSNRSRQVRERTDKTLCQQGRRLQIGPNWMRFTSSVLILALLSGCSSSAVLPTSPTASAPAMVTPGPINSVTPSKAVTDSQGIILLHFVNGGLEVVSVDPETGTNQILSTFHSPGKGVIVGAGDREAPSNRTQISPDFKWVALFGARYGFMSDSGQVVDVEDLLPKKSDFGYERRISWGRFGSDGLYYFPTFENGDSTYWAVHPETKKIDRVSRGRVESRLGGTPLTRESTEDSTWFVPGLSKTTCINALDIRERQCLFGSRIPEFGSSRGDGLLEVINLANGAGDVWWPNGIDSAKSVRSLVPPNDRSYTGGVFSPDGGEVAFLAVSEVGEGVRGDLFVVGVQDRNPRKLDGNSSMLLKSSSEVWVFAGWR